MNFYQRLGTFLARCYAVYVICYGLLGIVDNIIIRTYRLPMDYDAYSIRAHLCWAIGGAYILRISDRIGRRLGKGLEFGEELTQALSTAHSK